MAYDYFTIHSLAGELDRGTTGRDIHSAESGRERLLLGLDNRAQVVIKGGRRGALYLRSGEVSRMSQTREGPEKYLINAKIESVRASDDERIVEFRLLRQNRKGERTYGRLVVELIHPHFMTLLVSERTGEILWKWGAEAKSRGAGVSTGEIYRPPDPHGRLIPGRGDDWGKWVEEMREEGGEIGRIAPGRLTGMDRSSFAEVLYRSGLEGERRIGEFADEEWDRLQAVLCELYENAGREQTGYLWDENGRSMFSALCPTRISGDAVDERGSISQAIEIESTRFGRGDAEGRARNRLTGKLKGALKSARRRLRILQKELKEAETAEIVEKKGNALMANLANMKSGMECTELADVYDIQGQEILLIELDPRKTPAENASIYLKRAKKYRRRLELLPARIERTEEQIRVLDGFLRDIDSEGMDTAERIDKWLMENGMVKGNGENRQGNRRHEAHPRRYRTSTGWSVWAGRNNRENDVLTHRLAAQNDLWFHAHGYPGSHVILRREGRKEDPDGRTIEEAARVAAFWSKGKTAKKVPVVYTFAKYVSKPRGGAPGQAAIRREKTLMVEPCLLIEEDKIAHN